MNDMNENEVSTESADRDVNANLTPDCTVEPSEAPTQQSEALEQTDDASSPAEGDAESSTASKKNKKNISALGEFFEYFELFIFSACIVLLIFSSMFRVCRVDGRSMEDTLKHDEMLLVTNLFYTPEYKDIIVFHQTGTVFNEPIVKRVIATEGQWVDINADSEAGLIITVYDENKENPVVLTEDYAKYVDIMVLQSDLTYPVQVPEGCLFVMGDNRNHSSDSRFNSIGFVDERRVLGKVICRITPFEKFGEVE